MVYNNNCIVKMFAFVLRCFSICDYNEYDQERKDELEVYAPLSRYSNSDSFSTHEQERNEYGWTPPPPLHMPLLLTADAADEGFNYSDFSNMTIGGDLIGEEKKEELNEDCELLDVTKHEKDWFQENYFEQVDYFIGTLLEESVNRDEKIPVNGSKGRSRVQKMRKMCKRTRKTSNHVFREAHLIMIVREEMARAAFEQVFFAGLDL